MVNLHARLIFGETNIMERKTKKEKKEGDTCRDCWTKRFRKDIYRQWLEETDGETSGALADFLNRELQAREDTIKNMREEFGDIYDEISAIQDLAGDVFMNRFDREEDQSS
jgi:hypothetical protein